MLGVEQVGTGITLRLVVRTRPADQWRVQRHCAVKSPTASLIAGVPVPANPLDPDAPLLPD